MNGGVWGKCLLLFSEHQERREDAGVEGLGWDAKHDRLYDSISAYSITFASKRSFLCHSERDWGSCALI